MKNFAVGQEVTMFIEGAGVISKEQHVISEILQMALFLLKIAKRQLTMKDIIAIKRIMHSNPIIVSKRGKGKISGERKGFNEEWLNVFSA